LDPTLAGKEIKTLESRFNAGMQIRPWQFVYLNLAYAHLHGRGGAEGGLGIRF